MSVTSVTVWSFLVLLALITLSGALSVIRKRKTPEDYLVASREVSPWLSALSTVATNNSGFMFIGMIAYTYRLGVESVWMMVGWVLGDLLMWIFVHPRLRRVSAAERSSSLPGHRSDGSPAPAVPPGAAGPKFRRRSADALAWELPGRVPSEGWGDRCLWSDDPDDCRRSRSRESRSCWRPCGAAPRSPGGASTRATTGSGRSR